MITIIEANKDGQIELTKQRLEELLKEAYDEGYKDGSQTNPPFIYPYNPITNPSVTWDWTKVTCNNEESSRCTKD